MKKIITLLLVFTLAITAFAGCGSKSKLEGSAEEILTDINGKVTVEVVTLDGDVLEDGMPTYGFGKFSQEDFAKAVAEGKYTTNAMSSIYHHIIVLKFNEVKDIDAYKQSIAKTVKEFEYVCGNPEAYYVNDSGNYLFIAVTFEDYVGEFGKAFEELSGTFGKAITGTIE